MKIISWEKFISKNHRITKPSSATVGVFDGVHYGHKYLIDKLNDKNIDGKNSFHLCSESYCLYKKQDLRRQYLFTRSET